MSLVEIDTSNPEALFATRSFDPVTKGKHLFEIENDLVVEPAKSSDNNVISVVLVCQDDDENKGRRCWDTFTIINNPTTDKQIKAKAINQARLSQFAVACGVRTREEIEGGAGIPLGDFKGNRCEAITKIEQYKDPNDLDGNGEPKKKQRARVARYLFEQKS